MLQVLQGLEPCARAANWCMVPCGILSLICHLLQACNCTVQVVRLNSRYHALSGSRTVPSGFDPYPLPWLQPLSPSLFASCDSIFLFVSCRSRLLFCVFCSLVVLKFLVTSDSPSPFVSLGFAVFYYDPSIIIIALAFSLLWLYLSFCFLWVYPSVSVSLDRLRC